MDESERQPRPVATGVGGAAMGDLSAGASAPPIWAVATARETAWRSYLARVAGGDQRALALLYDESCRLVYGLAVRILGDAADAEEVALDVYNQVWRTAGSFDDARGSASSWLTTMARSRAIDRLRARATRRDKEQPFVFDVADRAPLPDQSGAAEQEAALVRAALAALPREQREALELAYFSGLSHAELAARLGQPLGTVKTRIRLGMMKLRETLAPLASGAAWRSDATSGANR